MARREPVQVRSVAPSQPGDVPRVEVTYEETAVDLSPVRREEPARAPRVPPVPGPLSDPSSDRDGAPLGRSAPVAGLPRRFPGSDEIPVITRVVDFPSAATRPRRR